MINETMKLKEKSMYTFLVKSMVIDGRGTPFYMLQNTEDKDDTCTYRVRALDYQVEWKPLPKTLRCFVKKFYDDGNPHLVQPRRDLLEDVYRTLPSVHTMVVTAKLVDEQTHRPYFLLQDSAKLQHRYYYAPAQLDQQYQVGDDIELYVEQIKGNDIQAYLDLKALQLRRKEINDLLSRYLAPSVKEEASTQPYLPVDCHEGAQTEWKSSIVFPAGYSTPDMDKQLSVIARTACGFLNCNGGELLIGVTDKGRVIGIENDFDFLHSQSLNRKYEACRDGYELALRDALREKLGNFTVATYVSIDFQSRGAGLTTCSITIQASPLPAFFDETALYLRSGNMTNHLKGEDITRFILRRVQNSGVTYLQTLLNESRQMESDATQTEEHNDLDDTYGELAGEEKEAVEMPQSKHLLPSLPQSKTSQEPYARIARVIVFRKDGSARFENNYAAPSDDILWQQEIPQKVLTNSHKYSLVLSYESGCINRVSLQSLNIGGKGTKNGWNTKDKLFNIFLAENNDKVAVYTQARGVWHVKVHQLSDISEHRRYLHLQGIRCCAADGEGCRIYHITSYHRDIENLLLTNVYRNGINMEFADSYDRLTMKTLQEVCEESTYHV